MIVLHGLGDSMEGYRWLPDQLGVPWLNYLLVNAPDDYYGGYSWYDIYGDAEPGIRRSRELLNRLLDDQRSAGFASDQTLLFGFSQGCLMTLETGLRYPHRLAGLVGISGYVHDAPTLLAERPALLPGQRVLMTHGTQDPLIPIAQVRAQVKQLVAGGVNLEWKEFDKVHTIEGERELAVIRRFIEAGFPEETGK